jgi:hypothetical protein
MKSIYTNHNLTGVLLRAFIAALLVLQLADVANAQRRQRDNTDGESGNSSTNNGGSNNGNSGSNNTGSSGVGTLGNNNGNNSNNNFGGGDRRSRNRDRDSGGFNSGGGNFGAGGGFERRGRSGGGGNDQYSELYGVISDYNIFMKNRGPTPTFDRGPRNTGPATPEQAFILTGVVFEEDEPRAYFESVTQGTIVKLRVGEQIARGIVGEIHIDAIYYARGDEKTWVDVGSYLNGQPAGSVSQARVNAALGGGGRFERGGGGGNFSTGAAPAVPAPSAILNDPNFANLSMEERLRLRRLQEANPGAIQMQGQPQQPQPQGNGGGEDDNDGDGGGDGGGGAAVQGQPGAGAAGDPNANLSVEERLRLRRMQEVGR